ncbi:endonuclease/exonuclease/phosphatase family protein [Stella sp.]|uniref:endonuclease/exonuclease/phosphatase family protein n=1 Tax=Stella sp. TaxID=2912054 RepID=UPI0035B4A4D2
MRLRIATYNLENFDDEGPLPLDRRLPVLGRTLARLDADILCLQEVNAQEAPKRPRTLAALDRLVAGTPYAGFHRALTTSEGGDYPRDIHNLVILSRHPIRTVDQVAHRLVPPVDWRWLAGEHGEPVRFERPILAVVIDVGRPLHLLDLHLRAPLAVAVPGGKTGPFAWRSVGGWAEGYFLAAVKRQAQALEARLLIESIFDRDPEAWIVVAGDLNAEEREVPLAILAAPTDATGNPALAARSLASLAHLVPADRRFTVRHGRGLLLDHILVSQALARRCTGVEILNAELSDEADAARAGFDDPAGFHAPMVAAFELA